MFGNRAAQYKIKPIHTTLQGGEENKHFQKYVTQRFTASQDFSEATNWEIIRLALARMIFPTQDRAATQDNMQARAAKINIRKRREKRVGIERYSSRRQRG